jgi:hypothetical protein
LGANNTSKSLFSASAFFCRSRKLPSFNSSAILTSTFVVVADLNNNKYILLNTQQISSAGEYNFTFISEIKGAIQSNIGTIINFITKEPYVESVINEVSPTEVGFDYETDPVYRERIILSRELNALNTTEAITSQLLNTLNVNDAICYPVNTIAGVPANMLYVIVDGGSSADIAKVLATNSSCTAYHGSNQYFYTTNYGVLVETKWDNVVLEPIYLKFKIKTNSNISPEVLNNIKSTLVNLLITKKVFKLSQKTNISILIPYLNEVMQTLKIDGYVYDVLLSTNNINFSTDLTPALVKNRFDLIYVLYDNDFDKPVNWGRQFGEKFSNECNIF